MSHPSSFIDDLANSGKPVLILSGGEPLYRRDLFQIASYAKTKGLPVGCGVTIASTQMLKTEEVESWLKWVAEKKKKK